MSTELSCGWLEMILLLIDGFCIGVIAGIILYRGTITGKWSIWP